MPLRDVAALAGALERLRREANLRARLGEQARRRALGEFTSTATGKATLAVYRDVLAKFRGAR